MEEVKVAHCTTDKIYINLIAANKKIFYTLSFIIKIKQLEFESKSHCHFFFFLGVSLQMWVHFTFGKNGWTLFCFHQLTRASFSSLSDLLFVDFLGESPATET